MKNVQCAETNEETVFRFLEFLVIDRSKFNQLARKKIIPKEAQYSETDYLVREFFFTNFSF